MKNTYSTIAAIFLNLVLGLMSENISLSMILGLLYGYECCLASQIYNQFFFNQITII